MFSPLSSCLISRLACVVVNWLTMSRAVWLRVFLTPALMPLWMDAETEKKMIKSCNVELHHSEITTDCVCIPAANICCVRCLGNNIKIHLKVTKGLKNKTELVWVLHDRWDGSQSATDLWNKLTSRRLHRNSSLGRMPSAEVQTCTAEGRKL